MADYRIYAVKKDGDGDILLCFISDGFINDTFRSKDEARVKVRSSCSIERKSKVISLIEDEKKEVVTYYLKSSGSRLEFELGASVHVVDHWYIRTDRNDTKEDNLDEILEM